MEINGTIKVISEVQQVTEKFRKVDIVIVDNSSKYPNYIPCQLTQDKCDLAGNLKVGDEITASINLRGREWIKDGVAKYFVSVEIWKFEVIGIPKSTEGIPEATNGIEKNFQEEAIKSASEEQEDDLPF